jgi:hypothetical protein
MEQRPPLHKIRAQRTPVDMEQVAKQNLGLKYDNFFIYAMPCHWAVQAIDAGSTALAAGVVLWWVEGMNGHRSKSIVVRSDHLKRMHVVKRRFERGVVRLERAGLVKVERKCGELSKITLIV